MESKVRKVAILTNGGDAPGLNAVIRAIVKTARTYGVEVYGFIEGYKGIKEPIGEGVFDKHNICEPTLMILPGSCFDLSGNRMGYGKGYYDRYLEECYDKICKIGVCFSLQLLDEIPDVKATDIPMDYIICEKS